MKKSIKLILVLLIISIVFIIVGSITGDKYEYYRNVSDIVVGFYKSAQYDEESIKNKDKEAVETYLSTLTHKNEEICISDYVAKKKENKTNEKNSKNIYIKNNKCYIKYDSLNISKTSESDYEEMENYDVLVCNGYRVILYKSMFNDDYKNTIKNPKYNYVFYDYEKYDNKYVYKYTSSYDGTSIKVILNMNGNTIESIEVE